MATHKEKKSETLEVRLPHTQKKAFMAACRQEGTTASDAVRSFVTEYVAEHERTFKTTPLRGPLKEMSMTIKSHPKKAASAAFGLVGAALMFGATPSMADDDVFAALDKNGDKALTLDELPEGGDKSGASALLSAMDANQDGKISKKEFSPKAKVISVLNEGDTEVDGEKGFIIHGKRTEYDLTNQEQAKIAVIEMKNVYTGEDATDPDAKIAEMRKMLETGDFGDIGTMDELTEGDDVDIEVMDDGRKKIRKRIVKTVEKTESSE